MGKTVTVNTGFTNVALGMSFYDAGESVDITTAEYDNLVENFGDLDALEVVLTIGGSVADPVYVPVISSRLASLESRVGVSEGDIDDLEATDTAYDDRLDDLEANDIVQDAAISDHEDRITALEP
jgi:hypothetical protein